MSTKLGVHFAAVIAIAACLFLSNWQWQRAHVYQDAPIKTGEYSQLSPLRDYLPVTSIGVQTSISGQWVPEAGRLFCDRSSDLKQSGSGCLVVGLVTLSDASVAAVLLGHTESSNWSDFPTGPAVIQGQLHPSEDSVYLESVPNNPITTDALLEGSPGILHDGFLVSREPFLDLNSVKGAPERAAVASLHWRNVVYTFNWLVFALIIAAMWRRVILDMGKSEAN